MLFAIMACPAFSPAYADSSIGVSGFVTDGTVSTSNVYVSNSIGIGLANPQTTLQVSGTFRVQNAGTVCNLVTSVGLFSCSSDARLKQDIRPIPNALEKITKLRGVTYHWKNPAISGPEHIGVIAQEVEKVFPQAVHTIEDGTKTVDYAILVAPLIQSVRELKSENDTLRRRIEALEQGTSNASPR